MWLPLSAKVGSIVRSRTQTMEFVFVCLQQNGSRGKHGRLCLFPTLRAQQKVGMMWLCRCALTVGNKNTQLTGNIPTVHKKKTPWSESARELYLPSDRRLSVKRLPTCADRGCHVVSVTDPYGRILGFLDRSCYFSIK
jgi:hypothetical protein